MKTFMIMLLALLGFLTACNSPQSEVSRQATPLQKGSINTVVLHPTLNALGSTVTVSPVITSHLSVPATNVLMSPSHDFGWSVKDNILLYTKLGSATVWEYNVATGKHEKSSLDSPPWHLNEAALDGLPSSAENISSSPSRSKALFTVPEVRTTPSQNSNVSRQDALQLWLWEEGSTRQLGTLENCVADYHWSADEQVIVISTYASREPCDVQMWVIDLRKGSVDPLIYKSDYSDSIGFEDITNDGSAVLFNTYKRTGKVEEGKLYIRQISGGQDILVLERPYALDAVWLGSEQRLLVGETTFDSDGWNMFVYDPAKKESSDLTTLLPERYAHGWRISPDRKWLALLTEKLTEFNPTGLWVLDLRTIE